MDVFVARQAILDRRKNLYGYELLFRAGAASQQFDGGQPEEATAQVIANSLLNIGLPALLGGKLGGKKAFFNFDRAGLLSGLHSVLPQELTVVELLETVEADTDVIAACRALHDEGYQIALDDFIVKSNTNELIRWADIIKVDMRTTSRAEQERMLRTCGARGIAMLAEKVETHEEFEWALQAGYDYFQGYFFARPQLMRDRQIPAAKMACLRLLRELQAPELDFQHLGLLISTDVAFSYKLLRFVNSALFGHSSEISSIESALVLLEERGIRRWVTLAALPALAGDKPDELVTQSVLRARFSSLLADASGLPSSDQAFIMGLFSMLDALVDRPLDEVLEETGVAAPVTAALLGTAPAGEPLERIFSVIREYEAGDWDAVERSAGGLGIPVASIMMAYGSSLRWTAELLSNAVL